MATASLRSGVARSLAALALRVDPSLTLKRAPRMLNGVDDRRGWFSLFSGGIARHVGFQTDTVYRRQDLVLAQCTVFACITLIAGDIGKLRARLMEYLSGAGIWQETTSPAFSPVLRKPNRMQTWQQFAECWTLSKLTHGNAYILKVRDNRGVVVELYVLDPCRCRPLVSTFDGSVYYDIQVDDLSKVHEPFTGESALPASEIIHDRWNCLFHPLVGLSPLTACGLQASKALEIDEQGTAFFRNASRPGGLLLAPAEIGDETAKRLKDYFDQNFTGENAGKVAVLGDGLQYQALSVNPEDAQLIEQLQWTAKQIAACFHVPAYLVGAADAPPNSSVEAQRRDYYDRCLQKLIEGIENTLDEGLGIGLGQPKDGRTYGIALDLDGLLRMDSTALTASLKDQVTAGITAPNEARARLNLPPVEGGASPLAQQQNYSLAALSKRDAKDDPFDTGGGGGGGVARSGLRRLITKDQRAMDELQELVATEVAKAMAALPRPTIDPDTAASLISAEVRRVAGEQLAGQVDLALETLRPKLVAEAALLVPPGRDGQPGAPGRPGTPGDAGRDGRDGIDGKDGIGVDDLQLRMAADGRTLRLEFSTGAGVIVRELPLPGMPIDRGVYRHARGYAKGDCVTYGGSLWVATKDAPPGEAPRGQAEAWRLMVKGSK